MRTAPMEMRSPLGSPNPVLCLSRHLFWCRKEHYCCPESARGKQRCCGTVHGMLSVRATSSPCSGCAWPARLCLRRGAGGSCVELGATPDILEVLAGDGSPTERGRPSPPARSCTWLSRDWQAIRASPSQTASLP